MSAQPFFFDHVLFVSGLSLSSGNRGVDQSQTVSLKTSNEFDNIDSFEVHPASGRWSVTNTGYTVNINDNMLNMSDTGDGSADSYYITRELRDLSGVIECLFYLKAGGDNSDDNFQIRLYNGVDSGEYSRFLVHLDAAGKQDTYLDLQTEDGYKAKAMTDSEDVYIDHWYLLKIHYDILESSMRWLLYFENGTKVFDYYHYEVTASRHDIFDVTELSLFVGTYCKTNAIYQEVLVDYVSAPFKENEWTHHASGADSDWLEHDSWELIHVQDDINAQVQTWRLTVTNLDMLSGTMQISVDDASSMNDLDDVAIKFLVYCVDADDGDLHEAFEFYAYIGKDGSSNVEYWLFFQVDDTTDKMYSGTQDYDTDQVWISFLVGTYEDRSHLSAKAIGGWEQGNDSLNLDAYADIAVSDVATDPSQEFVLEITYSVTLYGNTEAEAWIDNLEWITDSFWLDTGMGMPMIPNHYYEGELGEGEGGWNPFAWLAEEFGKLINIVLTATLVPILHNVQEKIELLQGFFDISGLILTAFLDAVGDFVDDILAYLGTVVDDVTGLFFTYYDDAGLPDILGILDKFFSNLVTTIGKVPDGFDDIKAYIDFWAKWIVIGLTVISLGYPLLSYIYKRDIGLYMQEFIKVQTTNINPLQGSGTALWVIPIGMYIPYCLLWFPLFLFELGWSG